MGSKQRNGTYFCEVTRGDENNIKMHKESGLNMQDRPTGCAAEVRSHEGHYLLDFMKWK